MKSKAQTILFRALIAVLALAVFVSPFAVLVSAYLLTTPVYGNTFYGELDDKYDALYRAQGEKIVLIGGSSVAFGYDSETLSTLFDRPVINFGLYAALGTKLMLDLSEDAIGEGDIVLLAPELDPETLSLYFNGGATLRASDEKPAMLKKIKRENLGSLFGALWSVTGEKLHYGRVGAPDPDGVYNSRYFNPAGDLDYPRGANLMDGYYDPTTPVTADETIVSPDFLAYLNAWIDRVKGKGATVYYVFCPINAMALTENRNGEEIPLATDALETEIGETSISITGVSLPASAVARCDAFETYLEKNLHCPLLGRMTDFVYPPNYFYDTNFHLNTTGVEWHTAGVGNLLFQKENGTDETPLARMGWLPPLTVSLGDMETVYDVGDLSYRLTISETFAVVGVTDAGLEKETIVLPPSVTVFDRKLDREITCPVSLIATGAFSGAAKLSTVVIGDQSRMSLIGTRAFENSSVVELYLFCPVEGFLAGKNMLGDAQPGFRIRVGFGLGYETDYSWGEFNVEGKEKILTVTDKTFADFAE
ncbi:MAG: hypothetical protein J5958_04360 [Clostridia bacterium]|nr:hypothetical protein [Clostridia bacterium]